MNNKTTNILALIALILQAVYVFGGFIIVAIQKKLFFCLWMMSFPMYNW